MKTILTFIFILGMAGNIEAQSFNEFISTLPEADTPIKWLDDYYLAWEEKDIPKKLFTDAEIDYDNYKAIGKVDFDTCVMIFVKAPFNQGVDFLIDGIVYNKNGDYCDRQRLVFTGDGESLEFSITSDNKIKTLNSGADSGFLKTYSLVNGKFHVDGDAVFIDGVDEFLMGN